MPRPSPSLLPPFSRPESRVAIRRVSKYEADLGAVLFETLSEFDLPVRGKTILLKPNLVGLDPLGMMNTHPAVIAAVRESFLRLGAAQVMVGDGPAMDRDTQAVLESIRLREFAGKLSNFFVDLNVDDLERVPLKTQASRLRELYSKNWLSEDRPYWLPNVLVRYDTLAREMQEKIIAVRQAAAQFDTQKTLPPPQQLGFFLFPDVK